MHAMLIDDSYHVERVLANGACGLTELVTIDGAGPFVRKKIPLELARRRVWSILSECDSDRLPRVAVTYELPDCFVVVYDFIPGCSLQSVIEEKGILPVNEAVRYVMQVCDAAQALHEQDVVHRDITPGNIIVSSDGAHLVDLGIARIRVNGAVRDTASLGTWGFASPEQFGFAQSDARSDVYSLGRVLGCALVGLKPDEDGYDVALADANKVPSALKIIIDKACAFEPSARFQSASDMGSALAGFLGSTRVGDSQPAPSSLVSPADSGSKIESSQAKEGFVWSRKGIVVLLLGILAITVLAAGAVSFSHMDLPAQEEGESNGSNVKSTASTASEAEEGKASSFLEVGESGWTQMNNGQVNYVYALKNTNESHSVLMPSVRVVAQGSKGKVLSSQEGGCFAINPGETVYLGGSFESSKKPAAMNFEVVDDSSTELVEGKIANDYELERVAKRVNEFGDVIFSGTVSTPASRDYGFWTGGARVTVVMRDEKGKLVGCDEAFVDGLKKSGSAAFETLGDCPKGFSEYEVYAQDWM